MALDGVAEQLRVGHTAAIAVGRGGEFVAAVRAAYQKLLLEADSAGEPLRELRRAKLQVRVLPIQQLSVLYGLQLETAVVYIRSVRYLAPQ